MSRNTLYGLIALVGIAAGTLFWRYWSYQRSVKRQQEVTTLLERTEGKPEERIIALDSLMRRYPDDDMVRRVGVYQLLRAHAELRSDSATLVRAAERFLATDSSGAAYNYVSSVYADRRVNVAAGLRYANRALVEAREMSRPEGIADSQWVEQRRMMIGECEHIRGKLYALNGQPQMAIAALRAAADSVPDSPSILLTMANTYEESGQLEPALAAYMAVMRQRYDDPDAREAIRRLYPRLHDPYAHVEAVLDTLVEHARTARKAALLAKRAPRPAPRLTLVGTTGKEYRLDALKGKVVVMYLWATWCIPCQRLLPLVQQAYERFGSRQDLLILAVSLDQRTELVAPFVEKRGFTFPVAYGDREAYSRLKVQGLPTLLFIDPQGTIQFTHLGYSDTGDFVEELGWQIEALRERPVR